MNSTLIVFKAKTISGKPTRRYTLIANLIKKKIKL